MGDDSGARVAGLAPDGAWHPDRALPPSQVLLATLALSLVMGLAVAGLGIGFFETFLVREYDKSYAIFDERFPFLFNSYYVSAGPRHARAAPG